MIVNVPSWEDLRTISLQLYFKAWASLVEIVQEFDETYPDDSNWGDEWTGYVEASQSDLQSIYTLIQQSQEIGIKALIARVSPFLLLKRHEAKPTEPNGSTYDFSDFQTIDASELARVHDTFCESKLSKEFATGFDTLRRERNKIAHIGLFSKTLTPQHLIDVLLKQFTELYPDRMWLVDRVLFASKHRWADYTDYDAWSPTGVALLELWQILPRLNTDQRKTIFGLAETNRLICPGCARALERMMSGSEPCGYDVPTAFMTDTDKMTCVVCRTEYSLVAMACSDAGCDGKYAAADDDGDQICVVCGEANGVAPP